MYIVIVFLVIFYLYRRNIQIFLLFVKELWWPLSKLERRKRLLLAVSSTPFYLWNTGPVTKQEFMNNLSDTFTTSLSLDQIYQHLQGDYQLWLGDYIVATTSGTSGQMGVVVNDRETWNQIQAIIFKKIFYPHLHLFIPHVLTGIRAVFIVPTEGHFFCRKLPVPPVNLPNVTVTFLGLFDADLLTKINGIQPQIVYTFPSVLETFYQELSYSPIMIVTGSERLTFRSRLVAQFPNTEIIETYAASECPFLGQSCRFGTVHLNEEYCDVRLVDAQNNIITDPGIISERIYITNLVNTCQPVMNYQIDDCLEYVECYCGIPGRAVEIHGRQTERIVFRDRSGQPHVASPLILKTIFNTIPYQFSYQIVYNKNVLQENRLQENRLQENRLQENRLQENGLEIIISTQDSRLYPKVYERVAQNIQEYCDYYGVDIDYRFRQPPFIIDSSGKKKQIVVK